MIEHVRVFSAVVNLVVGTWIVIYVAQKRRTYDYPFLTPLIHHIVFYTLCICIILVGKYVELNLLKSLPQQAVPVLAYIAGLCAAIFGSGMLISLLRIAVGLKGTTTPLKIKCWILAGSAVLILAIILRILLPYDSTFSLQLPIVIGLGIGNLFVIDIVIPIGLIKFGRRSREKETARISRAFGMLYLSRWVIGLTIMLVLGLIFWWKIPESLYPFAAFLFLLYMNLVPFFWMKYAFLPYARSMIKFVDDTSVLKPIFDKYNITKREQEILRLIIDGKNNKQIEEALFISYHTVKNHVYNLYQKLGVKNRYELMHFITRTQNRE